MTPSRIVEDDFMLVEYPPNDKFSLPLLDAAI